MTSIRYEKTPPEPAREHEYAKLFPLLEGEARQRLVDDIRANGVIEPIVFLDGAILDGRNRYYAARELLIEYPRVDYEGDDPLAFVIGKNLHRRHLTDRQRADVAAKLAKLPKGRPVENPSFEGITVADAAKAMEVSVTAVERAKVVQERASPGLKAAYEAGTVSPSAAAEVAKLPAEEQEEIVAHGDDAILDAAKQIKERRRQERLARQRENDAARDKARAALPESIKRSEEAKAKNGSAHAAVESLDAIRAERDELLEENAALKSDIAELQRKIAKFDEMAVLFEKGGFDAVIAAKDETIRVQATRIETESADKATWMNKAKFWKKTAIDLGYRSQTDQQEAAAF